MGSENGGFWGPKIQNFMLSLFERYFDSKNNGKACFKNFSVSFEKYVFEVLILYRLEWEYKS